MADLVTRVGALELRNPILTASGTFGHGLEMHSFVPPEALGALVGKTVTLRPRPGNPMPRIHETEAGLLNSIGLENRGIETYIQEVLPTLAEVDTKVVANIGGEALEEFVELALRLDVRDEIDAIEVNLSCPNVDGGRLVFATDPQAAAAVIAEVRAATSKPVWAKLSPNVTRIDEIARAVVAAGADALTAVNTVLGMSVDWRTGRPGLSTVMGGYSGTAIKPIALRCAWQCARAVDAPVIGCGGITTADDVLEFLAAGCVAVQVGTASFGDPERLARLANEVSQRLDEAGCASVREVIGRLGREVESSNGEGHLCNART